MNLLDRLLGHDSWTTRQLLTICDDLADEVLDHQYDIGHRTLRKTFNHIIGNMEIWGLLMAGERVDQSNVDQSVSGMQQRLTVAEARLKSIAGHVESRNAWDELWTDSLDNPPRQKSFGSAIAHVITHGMHHRSQILYMLRLSGVESLPEGDVFSWESAMRR